ncbi:molybdenum cofactor guanylyltransferase MobA [Methylibium sp.]|uniref:molybdenum cofactor guanylyltransferase MobA n=1 Tax=Methylibium sp. TaxID=2067992 RepID=UPI003D0E2DD7
MIDKSQITGLILAGGRGSRMGGVDKGLQPYRGMPLALHILMRLAPQVDRVLINANRNLSAYESFGVPVWPDTDGDYAGPLAGFLAGLERCETPYLVSVPCDTPIFPEDLVERLAHALEAEDAELAMARSPDEGAPGRPGPQPQPVFCLMRATLMQSLLAFVHGGGRKIDVWTARQRCAMVDFDDPAAFANANTLAELRELEARRV